VIHVFKVLKLIIRKSAPVFFLRSLYRTGLYRSFIPPKGKIKKGDFDRITPFSKAFGYDRGGPVDRYYIENFLQAQSEHIFGRVLEIGDNDYTLRFGGSKVTKSDILNVVESPTATFIGDLSDAPQVPSNTFDCVILTQTLHLIYDYKAALQTCCRILKPGGTLLLTVPGISQIDQGDWEKYWLWSFTQRSVERILSEIFIPEDIEVEKHGNVFAASAFLYGIGVSEIKKEQMDFNDPHYQVVITAAAKKAFNNEKKLVKTDQALAGE
jgi:SAM-dependent methyltransferase